MLMVSAKYVIFEPSTTKFNLNRNIIAYSLVVFGFLTMLAPIEINETFRIFYILITFIIFLYFLITSLWSYQPLNGELKGELEFKQDTVIVNDQEFKIAELNNIYLHYEDYFGEKKHYIKGNLTQNLRQGVKNYITFSDASNVVHIYYFKIENKEDASSLLPFINSYNS